MSLIQESVSDTEPISTPGIEQVETGSCRGEPQTSGVGKGPHDPNLNDSPCGQDIFYLSKDSKIHRHSSNAVTQNRTPCLMRKNFQYYQETQEVPAINFKWPIWNRGNPELQNILKEKRFYYSQMYFLTPRIIYYWRFFKQNSLTSKIREDLTN